MFGKNLLVSMTARPAFPPPKHVGIAHPSTVNPDGNTSKLQNKYTINNII
jgi:hypothetical protein